MRHALNMADRSSKPPKKDVNELAFSIVQQATGQIPKIAPPVVTPKKNPAAVTLGRLGGLKGGKARSDALTPAKRKAIAEKAAAARWKKPDN